MLPGLRFLCAAIVLSISLLTFGLGAAALLRAAHQEFASVPSRPAPRERVFAQQADITPPALALLRAETDAAEEEAAARLVPDNAEPAAQPDAAPSVMAAAPDLPAAEPVIVGQPVTPLVETHNSAQAQSTETAAQAETLLPVQAPLVSEAPQASEAPSPADTKIAAAEVGTPQPFAEALTSEPEQPKTATLTPADAAIKIATLGGPPVEIETQASPIKAKKKSGDLAAKKRLRAERAAERRKIARRASAQRRAARATAADPFAQPFGGLPGVSTRSQ